jgi:uncharacterized membrane protein YdbT with pleckstrin-like domain
MEKQRIVLGSLPKNWRFFFLSLIILALLAGLGELIVHVSLGFALSVLLLVLVWGGVFSYAMSGFKGRPSSD